jgi:Cd2+/Zn2+-exporting ATPase
MILDRPVMLKEIAGCGVSAFLPQGRVYCGNKKLLEENGIFVSVNDEELTGSVVFVGVDGRFAGHFVISDTVKKDAKSAMIHLKEMGLGTVMLTGDEEISAQAVAEEVGIEKVYAKLLPQEKLETLQKLRETYGSVMFVGDGINDAPVLAGADVGAAMGSGADAAIEAADAVFMTSSVESIPEAVRIAKDTNRIAIQNVVFALAVKILVMILGLAGFANMWMAVFADTGVAMICVMNSIRVLYKK